MSDVPMKSELRQSMSAVMGAIKRLEKLHENRHGGYKFASVDDFKDEIRPLMTKHGLVPHVTEETFDLVEAENRKGEKTQIAKIKFKFIVEHVNGEETKPSFLTICLPYTGAQTSGAAQSYAIKEGLFKGLFMASSGDVSEEADLHDQNQYGSSIKLSKAEARPVFEALDRELTAIVTETRDHVELQNWWSANRDQINSLPADWHLTLKTKYANEWKLLKAVEDMDRKTVNGEAVQ